RPDENQVPFGQRLTVGDEKPAPICRAEVSNAKRIVSPREHRVLRRYGLVVVERDVGAGATEHRFLTLERYFSKHGAVVTQDSQTWTTAGGPDDWRNRSRQRGAVHSWHVLTGNYRRAAGAAEMRQGLG